MGKIIHAYFPIAANIKGQSVSLLHVLLTRRMHSKHWVWLPIRSITRLHGKLLWSRACFALCFQYLLQRLSSREVKGPNMMQRMPSYCRCVAGFFFFTPLRAQPDRNIYTRLSHLISRQLTSPTAAKLHWGSCSSGLSSYMFIPVSHAPRRIHVLLVYIFAFSQMVTCDGNTQAVRDLAPLTGDAASSFLSFFHYSS